MGVRARNIRRRRRSTPSLVDAAVERGLAAFIVEVGLAWPCQTLTNIGLLTIEYGQANPTINLHPLVAMAIA